MTTIPQSSPVESPPMVPGQMGDPGAAAVPSASALAESYDHVKPETNLTHVGQFEKKTSTDSLYQIVIIGSGPGGAEAALHAARLGVNRVLLVEKDCIGGGALRGGMIPVRSLMVSQRQLRQFRHRKDRAGIDGPAGDSAVEEAEEEELLVDWVNRQRHLVARLSYQLEEELRKAGVEIARGRARLLGGGRLHILDADAPDGAGREIQAAHVIIATGARPAAPDIAADSSGRKSDVGTSQSFVRLAEPPRNLVIVGGGHIGCEFAAVYNALGANVTLIEMGARLLPEMDREAGERLQKEFESRGVDVRLHEEAFAEWNVEPGLHRVRLLRGHEELKAEKVLLANGRVPNVDGLGLEAAGVHFDRVRGIAVDDFLQTSAPGVSAIGDVNGLCTLSDSVRAQAKIVVENALGFRLRFHPGETPRCIHTDPAVAAVGLSEDQARTAGRTVCYASAVFHSPAPASEPAGLVKLIADPLSHLLLGGMIVAERAPEWIGELSAALQLEARTEGFAQVPRANESFAAAIRDCACQMFP